MRSNSHAEAQASKGGGSIGRAAVSKTAGCRFESCPPYSNCLNKRLYARTPGVLFEIQKGAEEMASSATATQAAESGASSKSDEKRGFFGRIFAFLREVIAELKKVTTPTGRELIGYFLAVLLFVVVMLLLISGLDYLFGQGAFWIFGNGTIQRN